MNHGTETWTKDFTISGTNGPINLWENTQITIDGASVTIKPTNQSGWYGANIGFISGDGATLAFKNASVTVSGTGNPRLATSHQGGTVTFDNTEITLASGAQFSNTCLLQAMAAQNASKTSGKIEFNNTTITGSGEDQGIIFLVGSNSPSELNDGKGGWLTFKGTNKLENLGNKNGNGDIILVLHDSSQSGDPFAIEDGTTTISNSALALQYGGIFVENGGTLVIDNTILVPLQINTDEAPITVRSGGTLKFTNGSIYDLSRLGDKTAIRIERGGTLIVDNAEIRGAISSNSFIGSYIVSNGGDVQFINGGALKNNIINNRSDGASGNCILLMNGGSLTIDGGVISGNSTSNAYTGSPDSVSGAISATDTAVVIKNAVVENNSDYISGAIRLQRPKSVEISNSTFSGNTTKIRSAYANNLYTDYNGRIIVGTGGALSILNAAGPVNIENCTFTDNGKGDINNTSYTTTTYAGGAIFLFNSHVTIANSTFNGNTAAFYGGAINHVAGSLTLNDGLTITGNQCVYTFTDMPNSTSYNAVYGMGGAVSVEEYVIYNLMDPFKAV